MLTWARRFTLAVWLGAATLGCGSSHSVGPDANADAGGGGTGGSSAEGPPFQVGPRRYESYQGFDTQGALDCGVPLGFVYYEPAGSGPFPIFVFAKGSRGEWDKDSLIRDEMLKRMARLGFVAASPDYQSDPDLYPGPYGLTCAGFRSKSRCIFAPGVKQADSVIAVLERESAADSSLGIVTSGISQGAFVALLAGDFNPEVRAANPISIGTYCGSALDLRGCSLPASYQLGIERVRIVDGESDATFGGVSSPACDGMQVIDPVWFRQQLDAMTAMTCDPTASPYECLRPNGSGWVLARDAQLSGGVAHHAFPYANYPSTADLAWASTTQAWGREANQAWLAGMVEP